MKLPCAATFDMGPTRKVSDVRSGWVYEDTIGKKWAVPYRGDPVPFGQVFRVVYDATSKQPPPQCVVDTEHLKYTRFYECLERVAREGLSDVLAITVETMLDDRYNVPPRFLVPEGPHSSYASKVGYLMQFLLLSDPKHYFRELCALFPSSNDVSSFFPIPIGWLRDATASKVSAAFACVGNWTELLMALQLQNRSNHGMDCLAHLDEVDDFEGCLGIPSATILKLFAQATPSPMEQGKCVAQLMRIGQSLSPLERNTLWRDVDEAHHNGGPFWESVRSSVQKLQRKRLLGAIVKKSDVDPSNLMLLRVGARVCSQTCKLYADM